MIENNTPATIEDSLQMAWPEPPDIGITNSQMLFLLRVLFLKIYQADPSQKIALRQRYNAPLESTPRGVVPGSHLDFYFMKTAPNDQIQSLSHWMRKMPIPMERIYERGWGQGNKMRVIHVNNYETFIKNILIDSIAYEDSCILFENWRLKLTLNVESAKKNNAGMAAL